MKCTITQENKNLYFIPVAIMALNLVLRFFGADTNLWLGIPFIIATIATLAYNFIPTRITLDEKELRIHHILIRKISVDAIERVYLEHYVTRFKSIHTKRVRLMIVHRRKDEIKELFLNDRQSHTTPGKSTGKSSGLYDLRNYLQSDISKRKDVKYEE